MSTEINKQIQLEIAHVLFIDIVGYSKLSINDQRAAIDELTQAVRTSEQFQNAEAAGRLIKIPTGDGMALVFYKSPEEPMKCALEISRALKEHRKIQLRMGVHSGPVSGVIDVNGQVNLAGAGLNTAQRVMACGDAGHILLSRHVAEDLEGYEHWRPRLHDLGFCEVKHGVKLQIVNLCTEEAGNRALPAKLRAQRQLVARTRWILLATSLILLAGVVAAFVTVLRRAARSSPAAPEKSIADLKVISRTSTQHYKSAPDNLREIAKQLAVAHIVEGSVQKSGESVRVNVQLIKAANDSHLWADTFDRKLTDIFSVESEVAKAIADQLRAKLTGQEEQVIAAKPTQNVEAYDAYLRGLAYNLKAANSAANSRGAQKYLREAVRLDPKFAPGWALLSYVNARGYLTQTLQPTVALREEARQAVETALTFDPNLGEALHAKGYYHYACLKDYDTAVRYFEQARHLLPNSSRIPESLAYVMRRRGEWDRSESYFNEAERLDPRNVYVLGQHGQSYIALRRFTEALHKFDQILNITPDDMDTLAVKASVAQAEGDLPGAAALLAPLHPPADDSNVLYTQVYQAILERRSAQVIPRLTEILAKPDPAWGYATGEMRFWLGWAQDVAGDHAAARESWGQARGELEPFLKEQPENYNLLYDLALTKMGLGEKAAALTLSLRAMAAMPIERDAFDGPAPIEILARVAAQVGEPDRAIAALQELLSIPYEGPLGGGQVPLTSALLRLDPMFDPLRNDPRFQKLCEEKQQ
jgi:tetratricopeptide (TPR) repeat protein/class 3 adenylate cyclase